jgi:hypothetical protein
MVRGQGSGEKDEQEGGASSCLWRTVSTRGVSGVKLHFYVSFGSSVKRGIGSVQMLWKSYFE